MLRCRPDFLGNKGPCKLIEQGKGEIADLSKENWHSVDGRREWVYTVKVTTFLALLLH